jgi:LysM repeat protein
VIGIEAGNEGTGEPWPDVMQDSYVRGVAALADRYDIESDNVISHFEWAGHTKRAKIDPAGPSRFGTVNSAKSWDMNRFRAAVNDARANRGRLQPLLASSNAARSDIYVVQPGDAWWSIAEQTMGDPGATWESLADANGGKDRVLLAGQVVTIPGGAAVVGGLALKRVTADFPGEAKRGMKGPIVIAWQEALIAHGIIADTKGNHDGDYGESLEKAVLELQQSWGWSNADGVAGSGTWKKLQSAG